MLGTFGSTASGKLTLVTVVVLVITTPAVLPMVKVTVAPPTLTVEVIVGATVTAADAEL